MSRRTIIILLGFVVVLLIGGWRFQSLFQAPNPNGTESVVVFSRTMSQGEFLGTIAEKKLVRSRWALQWAVVKIGRGKRIEAGGYKLSPAMDVWEIAETLYAPPALRWVTIPEGLRKEQIAERLAEIFDWSESEMRAFTDAGLAANPEKIEGYYYPDTYLIPADESGRDVARRMFRRFDEVFAPVAPEFLDANIRNDTAVKMASLIQREAAGKQDMPLIAGILWNRLERGMKLEIDATAQYARGKTENGWWAPPTPKDLKIDSPYNTYRISGLPPHAICNPGMDAIHAVLNPETTECLFYLHDRTRTIHCAKTYEEHVANIKQFLRSEPMISSSEES